MNTNILKTYAPKARRDFIAAVTRRAAKFGLTAKGVSPVSEEGQLVIIEGQPYPRTIGALRRKLAELIKAQGFQQVMEAAAYTWFNRFAAIRFMELHGYLDHSFRVLSHPAGTALPEILEHATSVDLPGLDREHVFALKMDGTRDEELYRELLLAQCRAMNQAMPFLFERMDDEIELLLPDLLLQTDSLIRDLVTEIPEEDWQEIEIIGWLYQFYISEKKDQVIGKVVKSEDIPAATQLFTPNWIVKYMVQNSLGAQWLATYPESPLKGLMEYYIEPAEQTDEVKAQLEAITPSTLNPEELTLIDPACGSGHILVEAYELFKAIYLERGYRQRDVPKLILEKNLFGLDIDGRAAQLTGFALMMKGRADDRRLFERGVKLNVMALVDSAGFDAEGLAKGVELADHGLKPGDLTELKRLFEHATTFGSLIQVQDGLTEKLPALKQLSDATSQDLFVADGLKQLESLMQQAELLAARYDAVVANPPYLGGKAMNGSVKNYTKDHFPDAKSDLFACFIERGYGLAKDIGHNCMVTMESWMFLSSYERFRSTVLTRHTLRNLAHFPYDGKRPTAMGINFGVAVVTAQNTHVDGYKGHFCCSRYYELNDAGIPFEFPTPNERLRTASAVDFKRMPGSVIAYWASEAVRDTFAHGTALKEVGDTRQGMATSDNNRFLRNWPEVPWENVCVDAVDRPAALASHATWFPYNKGGDFRKYYGNVQFIVNWKNDGEQLLGYAASLYGSPTRTIKSISEYFKPSISWSKVTSGSFAMRAFPKGFLFDVAGCSIFSSAPHARKWLLLFTNSVVVRHILGTISPTLNFEAGQIAQLPLLEPAESLAALAERAGTLVSQAKDDWDAYERSWDFQSFPILAASTHPTPSLESSYTAWITQNCDTIAEMKRLEEENNRLFIDAYGLADELTPDVPIQQITLTVNPAYRYGKKVDSEKWIVDRGFGEQLETRFRQDTMKELVSYAIGCMMGRYSLDAPGLVYANSGNEDFDPSRYTTFPADEDGIVPLTDTEWFDDDAAHRLVEFISVAWDAAHIEDSLTFLANNLSPKKTESSRETIRRYFCDSFFKDHLQTYKKRPIYWLFSSGKQKAFQCLVYLHRYNEGTLARMRMEYVVPLQSKMAARIDKLADDVQAASTGAQAKRLQKERDKLTRQLEELRRYDEQLRHYADLRIKLDLDDGVKVNYGRFGNLLADVKAVTGRREVNSE